MTVELRDLSVQYMALLALTHLAALIQVTLVNQGLALTP